MRTGPVLARVLVVDDGVDRGSIAAVRALHADGWEVGVGAPVRGIAGSSRAAVRWHAFPTAEAGADAFVEAVNLAVARHGYELVIAGDDYRTLVLSERRDDIHAIVPYAGHDVVVRAVDKLALARAAESVGLATPLVVEATDEALAEIELPVVVKATLHDQPGRVRPLLAVTRRDAAAHVAEIQGSGGVAILQEVVPGGLMAYSFVVGRDGVVLAPVQQEDVHTWPRPVGVSAQARTVAADGELAEGVQRLVQELGWFGLAQLQFLRVPGRPPALIDWNARPYASMPLAIAAGINLPAIWARVATGRALAPIPAPRLGAMFQWFPGDLRASIAEEGTVGGSLRALKTAPHATQAIWALDDPWPGVRHYSRSASRFALGLFTFR